MAKSERLETVDSWQEFQEVAQTGRSNEVLVNINKEHIQYVLSGLAEICFSEIMEFPDDPERQAKVLAQVGERIYELCAKVEGLNAGATRLSSGFLDNFDC